MDGINKRRLKDETSCAITSSGIVDQHPTFPSRFLERIWTIDLTSQARDAFPIPPLLLDYSVSFIKLHKDIFSGYTGILATRNGISSGLRS
jgi:hypothetical protein